MEQLAIKNFRRDELCSLKLRGLFERRGFRRARVNKFEDYGLYVDNKSFLQSENIITFMDLNGNLLALKPDVTLSVVRGIPKKELPALEKLYYADEVYRISQESREYKVLNQIGVEIIGPADSFSNIEAADLALSSLSLISDSFVLDISHVGFVSGMLEHMGLTHTSMRRVLTGIQSKSPHGVAEALDAEGASGVDRNRVLKLCGLHGDFMETLLEAKDLITCEPMKDAYDELEALGAALSVNGMAKRMKLDFSIAGDLNYYNGLLFLGYVEGLPKVVLTGGRYDNLMKKMGKQSGAIGFAVSLDDLNTYFKSGKRYDFDMLLTYSRDCDYAALLSAAKQLLEQGISVRLESEASRLALAGYTWEKHCHFGKNGLEEGVSC